MHKTQAQTVTLKDENPALRKRSGLFNSGASDAELYSPEQYPASCATAVSIFTIVGMNQPSKPVEMQSISQPEKSEISGAVERILLHLITVISYYS